MISIIYSFEMIKKLNIRSIANSLNQNSQITLRTDFNVPIKNGNIMDLNRIKAAIPTIQFIQGYNPKSIVLLSHLGRPNGIKNPQLSLKPITKPLESMLGKTVTFLDSCVGEHIVERVNNAKNQIFLCENLRFHQEQEGCVRDSSGKKILTPQQKIIKYRKQLQKLGSIYVNDAFGCVHRAHSSIIGFENAAKVSGLLLEKEVNYLHEFLTKPKRPVVFILGGAKIKDKIQLIINLLDFADELIIGGGMSNPFLHRLYGFKLGSSRLNMPDDPTLIDKIMQKAKAKGVKIHLPVDGVCSQSLSDKVPTAIYDNHQVPQGWQIFDQGPKSLKIFDEVIQRAGSIFWNGPIGVFQLQNFKNGSETLLQSVIARTEKGALSIIGGGDTGNMVNRLGLQNKVSYISTGGGATLQYLQGFPMPGLHSLDDHPNPI